MLVTLPIASFVFSLLYDTFHSALHSKVSVLEMPRLLSATAGRQVPLAKPESVFLALYQLCLLQTDALHQTDAFSRNHT